MKRDIYYKKKISPQNEPHTAKLSFSGVLKHLRGKWLKTSLFGSKTGLSQKEDEEYSEKWYFFNKSEKVQILRKILILNGTTFFGQTSETGQILTKTVFLIKISHIQLFSFSAVLKFFHGNWQKTSHSIKKCDGFRLNLRITQKIIFSQQVRKRENSEKIFDLMETTFFCQTSEMGQTFQKTFFLLKIRHIQLNYTFLVLWSIFAEIDWKLLFLGKKRDYLRKKLGNTHNFFFLNKFEKGANPEKFFNLIETTFFGQTSKMGQILTITFFILKMSHVQLN